MLQLNGIFQHNNVLRTNYCSRPEKAFNISRHKFVCISLLHARGISSLVSSFFSRHFCRKFLTCFCTAPHYINDKFMLRVCKEDLNFFAPKQHSLCALLNSRVILHASMIYRLAIPSALLLQLLKLHTKKIFINTQNHNQR